MNDFSIFGPFDYFSILLPLAVAGGVGTWIHLKSFLDDRKAFREGNPYGLPDYLSWGTGFARICPPFCALFSSVMLFFCIVMFWMVPYRSFFITVIKETDPKIPYAYSVTEEKITEYRRKDLAGTWVEGTSSFVITEKGNPVYMDDISIYENVEGVVYE